MSRSLASPARYRPSPTAPPTHLFAGQRPAPLLGDRVPQPFGVDGLGVEEPLQPDPAKLPDDGDRDLVRVRRRHGCAVGDTGGDVLAQVGAERLVPLAEDRGQFRTPWRPRPRAAGTPGSTRPTRPSAPTYPSISRSRRSRPGGRPSSPGTNPAWVARARRSRSACLDPKWWVTSPAAVPGPLADARQRQRAHPLFDDQFGGGVRATRIRPGHGAAAGCGGWSSWSEIYNKLVSRPTST